MLWTQKNWLKFLKFTSVPLWLHWSMDNLMILMKVSAGLIFGQRSL